MQDEQLEYFIYMQIEEDRKREEQKKLNEDLKSDLYRVQTTQDQIKR